MIEPKPNFSPKFTPELGHSKELTSKEGSKEAVKEKLVNYLNMHLSPEGSYRQIFFGGKFFESFNNINLDDLLQKLEEGKEVVIGVGIEDNSNEDDANTDPRIHRIDAMKKEGRIAQLWEYSIGTAGFEYGEKSSNFGINLDTGEWITLEYKKIDSNTSKTETDYKWPEDLKNIDVHESPYIKEIDYNKMQKTKEVIE